MLKVKETKKQEVVILKSCAWCNDKLNKVPDDKVVLVSHGICPKCRDNVLEEFRQSIA